MKEIFKKDIERNINGVIKVGQRSTADIQQELEEYVLTRELRGYFDKFYRHFTDALAQPTDAIGVWISGFFGSGKSHFLKILSYLLDNREVAGKQALDYLAPKVEDAMLLANMTKAAGTPKDVILFNIDSKAEASSKAQKEAIVRVLLKVFDEHQGFFGTSPEIADFERRLSKQGNYQAFLAAYQQAAGEAWHDDRENWDFREDEVIEALQAALGMSQDAAQKFFDRFGEHYAISVEGFAKIVKEYLESKPNGHQVVFMVDEVGQYIGENPDLMLNLQTVAEDLGTFCEGRAWIMVTSQEDIDSITQHRVRGNDFSKIQGRFKTRISLSSANTDEVIKLRLLDKTEAAADSLRALYASKSQVLRNQIRFSSGTAEMPGYRSDEDFVRSYPFVPYQFQLLQRVFTQIRLHGASGKHLAAGERSMLDAFQLAAQQLQGKPLGALAPFDLFYRAVEGFIDTNVKQIISQAEDNRRLEPFDLALLKTLFMIKYVEQIKGTPENLTTLSLTDIDDDRVALAERVQAALGRLEQEVLIQRSGEHYEFLTNEEQDISREIREFTYNPGEAISELQSFIWEDIFPDKRYRLDARHEYRFNRQLDQQGYGQQSEALTLQIITPEGDSYQELQDDAAAQLRSGPGTSVLVRLPDERAVFDELTQYLKTDRYLKRKHDQGLSSSVRMILQARADENRERRERIRSELEELISRADVFVKGSKVPTPGSSAKEVLSAGLKSLVENTYTKLAYVKSHFETTDDIEAVLQRGPDAATLFTSEHPNALAHQAMQQWLGEQQNRHQTVTLRSLEETFAGRPYGWARRDIHGVLAELLIQSKVELRQAQSAVDIHGPELVRKMATKAGLDAYTVRLPRTVNPEALRVARELAQEYLDFATVPNDPQRLYERYQQALDAKRQQLEGYLAQAQDGAYPFKQELDAHHQLLDTLAQASEAAAFFEALREHEDAFEDMCEQSSTISSFYDGQRELFDKSRRKLQALASDLRHLEDRELLKNAEEAERILSLGDPTRDIHRLSMLLQPVEAQVQTLIEQHRQEALRAWQRACQQITDFASEQGLADSELGPLMQPLHAFKSDIDKTDTIDAAVARLAMIDSAKKQADTAIVERLNDLASQDGQLSASKAKPITTLRPASLSKKSVLESEADIDAYLRELRSALLEAYQAGQRVRIE